MRGRLVDILRNKGQLRYRQRKYDEARKLLQEAIDIGEKQVDDFPDIRSHRRSPCRIAITILADVLWAAGREDDGDDSLRRATFHRDILVKAAPKLTIQQQDIAGWSHFILGKRLHARGREAEAMSEYRRAQDLFEEAVEKFPQAFRRISDSRKFWRLARRLSFGIPSAAAIHARRVLQRDPESPEAWRILGIALYLSRDWPAAEQAFVKSFELQPGRSKHGRFLLSGDLATAIK